jgi:hypothetical protein
VHHRPARRLGWRGRNEEGGLAALPDGERVALNDRETFIAFDSDVMTKPPVRAALARLKAFLESRGRGYGSYSFPPDRARPR